MRTLAVEDAGDLKLAELLCMVPNDDVLVLTEEGEERYVIGTVDDLQQEAVVLSRNAGFMSYLDDCRARGDREGRVSIEEFRRSLGESRNSD